MASTKPSENTAECGNKSKPLLDEVSFSVGTYNGNQQKWCDNKIKQR